MTQILAVSPANSDLATSDAVKLASDVDPEGKRTIGVLTKLDIMDAGTDAREVLTGKTMPLNHGWIGVVNRSQADINGNKNMAQTRRKERDFFSGHKAYTDLENTGVDKLSDKLCSMLQNKIIQQIPKIRDFLHKNIADTRSQLDALGQPIEYDRAFMFKTVLEAARRFEDAYSGFVDEGEGGGNQILRTFEEKLRAEIEAIPLMESYYARDKVARTIDASDGWQKHLIAPETGYRKLVTLGIDTIKSPSLECVNAVHEILRKGIQDAIGSVDELSAFSVLRAQLESAAMESLDRLCIDTKATVATMISAEAAFIDAEFFRNIANSVSNSARNESSARAIRKKSAASSVASELVPREDEEIAANEDDAVEDDATDVCDPNDKMTLIGRTCHSYVRRVMRQQARSIPKAIVLKSVIQSKRQLIQSFYDTVGGNDDEALTREALHNKDQACQSSSGPS